MGEGLYNPRDEHDACGVGFIASIDGTSSHSIIDRGVDILENLIHRGADNIDDNSGDGAGLLVQLPHKYFRHEAGRLGSDVPEKSTLAVGSFFMPRDEGEYKICRAIVESIALAEGLGVRGWREIPVDPSVLGRKAATELPVLRHLFVSAALDETAFERRLYVVRRLIEKKVDQALPEKDEFYISSLSCRTINYKGMMKGDQVRGFYKDLQDEQFSSAMAVVHQRYSTNTFPSWKLAQPFRITAHNGEINTLRGNIKHMKSREESMYSELLGEDLDKILPVIDDRGSDSGCLDNAVELLAAAGRDLPAAMMMLVPQAWGEKYPLGPDLKGFFEYHAGLMEPWDGPAALVCSNGRQIVAMLDRNGLRPARYTVTKDGYILLASETGVLEVAPENIAERGALRPGQILAVDMPGKRLRYDEELKRHYARRLPYRRWVNENRIDLHGFANDISVVAPDLKNRFFKHKLFGYTREDIRKILVPMAEEGHEPVGAMGYDAPLAVLSGQPQLLYNYFKQIFSQVTNPAIDPIREELVMSLMTFMGNSPNILNDTPENARLIKLKSPIVSNENLERIRRLKEKDFRAFNVPIGFDPKGGESALTEAIRRICADAETYALERRKAIIVLSDRILSAGQSPIPALLAVSAVNQHLAELGLRCSSSIVIETGEAREVQHMALLLGYGATAINPYLAFETISGLSADGKLKDVDSVAALENYIKALDKGLLKIMSKMGISTLRSYRGAQIFEAVGLKNEVVDKYFPGTPSNVEGIGLDGILDDILSGYENAQATGKDRSRVLPGGGCYSFKKDGEQHLWTPQTISKLQRATRENNESLYREYTASIDNASCTLRSLLEFKKCNPTPLEDVESAESIMKRFVTSAMSFGSLSRQAHETLAIAMNRIGAMSNSGEGGEDPERYELLPNGDNRCSMTKQLASGRFGVTTEYLVHAKDLQIKIAQGAKPGEGGQLPGHKVNSKIADVRNSTPGVTLISPPPHHDIYSIEDIKQLIFDLKNVNPEARVSVKLVSESGVGTIAAGVAKGRADMILISGGDGGTGAAPLTSIKYAGAPWEIGLAETQQVLVSNNLRGNVRLQVDGQMKTGRDVVVGALLGGEEFGFGTCPLIVCGCVMLRHCNQNNCSVGVATQRPELCKRYSGKPEHVINFFRMVANEAREYMAALGLAKFDDLIGRVDLLKKKAGLTGKLAAVDFEKILHRQESGPDRQVRCIRQHKLDTKEFLDKKIMDEAGDAVAKGGAVSLDLRIKSTDRAVCSLLSGRIAKLYGSKGLPAGSLNLTFRGYAGQSFAAFGMKGVTARLVGEANDYVAKGLSGAKVVIVPPEGSTTSGNAADVLCGNVAAYGATSGELYISGRAGERFAVRNSGITAVVEGVGDHCCEYMTGGRVVVLGETGINFAAGMSGGLAYVYDPENRFDGRCNLEMVDLENLSDPEEIMLLQGVIKRHLEETGSTLAARILENWERELVHFLKVFPMEYRRVLGMMSHDDLAVERQRDWTR